MGREPLFDHVTQLAADLLGVPVSLLSIVGSDTQCFRGICGLEVDNAPRNAAFCAFAILQHDVMVVPDATQDDRFRANPFVTGDPHILASDVADLLQSPDEIATA